MNYSKKLLIVCIVLFNGIMLNTAIYCVYAQEHKKEVKETGFNVGTYSEYVREKYKKDYVPYNFLTISQINRNGIALHVYETQGYVVNEYECPPCPEGNLCKPCMQKHIVISEEPTEFNFSSIMDKQMVVFINKEQKFRKERKYKFVVRVLDVKTTDQPINNVDLIYAKRIK